MNIANVCADERTTCHSHSMVPGGFEVTSYTTRFTPRTSLVMRFETWAINLASKGYQSAVMPSLLVTALSAITLSYVRLSPWTPTVFTGNNTQNACQILS